MTRSTRSIAIALPAVLAAATLAGCAAAAPAPSSTAPSDSAASPLGGSPSPTSGSTATPRGTRKPAASKPSAKPSARSAPAGPRIVSFRIAQRPKCAEGTAVFRADPVPLIIEWKISGATGGALSVDDPTHTPGTYGSVGLQGTEEFQFTCAGDVGSTETHTYAIYTVGGGPTRSATLTASAKILDKGKGAPS